MSEQAKPQLLGGSTLAEIEARPVIEHYTPGERGFRYVGQYIVISAAERDALCQTVRAAWRQTTSLIDTCADLREGLDDMQRERDTETQRAEAWRTENAALREQLAQAQRCHADAEEDSASAQLRTNELESRLAQVEKERNKLRADLELGEEQP